MLAVNSEFLAQERPGNPIYPPYSGVCSEQDRMSRSIVSGSLSPVSDRRRIIFFIPVKFGHFDIEAFPFGNHIIILTYDFLHAMFDVFLEELPDGRCLVLHFHQW